MAAFIEPPGPLRSGLSVIDFHLTPPTNPPAAKDVADAVFYAEAVIEAKAIGSDVTDEEVSAAAEYQASVVSAKNIAGAPPWFQTAMTHINGRFDRIETENGIQRNRLNQSVEELKTSINGLRDSVVGLQDEVHELKQQFVRVDRTSSVAFNRGCGIGSDQHFQEVPFIDGTYPVKDHNLPLIESVDALRGMNSLHLKRYHQKYCPGRLDVDGRLDDNVCIPEVLRAIGSTAR